MLNFTVSVRVNSAGNIYIAYHDKKDSMLFVSDIHIKLKGRIINRYRCDLPYFNIVRESYEDKTQIKK